MITPNDEALEYFDSIEFIKAPETGMRVSNRVYESGETVPIRYRRRLDEASRPIDPMMLAEDAPPNLGRSLIPHTMTFSGMLTTLSRAFRNPDAAIQHSVENANSMLLDPAITGPLFARQKMVALLNWHIEPEDDNDPRLKAVAEKMTKILHRTDRFVEYRRSLMMAIWTGRHANQHRYGWHIDSVGNRSTYIRKWEPIDGDKLVFRYNDGSAEFDDEEFGVRVSPAHVKEDVYAGKWQVEYYAHGSAVFWEQWERNRVCLHKHFIQDAPFEEPDRGGSIHGLGLRNYLYWAWYMKQEVMAKMVELVDRAAMGLTLYFYDQGNPEAKKEMRKAAQESAHTNVILIPKSGVNEIQTNDIQQIPPNVQGIEALRVLLDDYFGSQITKMILGQTLSTKAEATGIGTGVADLHLDSLKQIIKYDAVNLEETLTNQVLRPLIELNEPRYMNHDFWLRIATEAAIPEKELEAILKAYEMGAPIRTSDLFDRIGLAVPSDSEDKLMSPEVRLAQQQIAIQDMQLQQAQQQAAMPQQPPQAPPGQPVQEEPAPGQQEGPVPQEPQQQAYEDRYKIFGPILNRKKKSGEPERHNRYGHPGHGLPLPLDSGGMPNDQEPHHSAAAPGARPPDKYAAGERHPDPQTWFDIGHEGHAGMIGVKAGDEEMWFFDRGRLFKKVSSEGMTTHEEWDDELDELTTQSGGKLGRSQTLSSTGARGRIDHPKKQISIISGSSLPDRHAELVTNRLLKDHPDYDVWQFAHSSDDAPKQLFQKGEPDRYGDIADIPEQEPEPVGALDEPADVADVTGGEQKPEFTPQPDRPPVYDAIEPADTMGALDEPVGTPARPDFDRTPASWPAAPQTPDVPDTPESTVGQPSIFAPPGPEPTPPPIQQAPAPPEPPKPGFFEATDTAAGKLIDQADEWAGRTIIDPVKEAATDIGQAAAWKGKEALGSLKADFTNLVGSLFGPREEGPVKPPEGLTTPPEKPMAPPATATPQATSQGEQVTPSINFAQMPVGSQVEGWTKTETPGDPLWVKGEQGISDSQMAESGATATEGADLHERINNTASMLGKAPFTDPGGREAQQFVMNAASNTQAGYTPTDVNDAMDHLDQNEWQMNNVVGWARQWGFIPQGNLVDSSVSAATYLMHTAVKQGWKVPYNNPQKNLAAAMWYLSERSPDAADDSNLGQLKTFGKENWLKIAGGLLGIAWFSGRFDRH